MKSDFPARALRLDHFSRRAPTTRDESIRRLLWEHNEPKALREVRIIELLGARKRQAEGAFARAWPLPLGHCALR